MCHPLLKCAYGGGGEKYDIEIETLVPIENVGSLRFNSFKLSKRKPRLPSLSTTAFPISSVAPSQLQYFLPPAPTLGTSLYDDGKEAFFHITITLLHRGHVVSPSFNDSNLSYTPKHTKYCGVVRH